MYVLAGYDHRLIPGNHDNLTNRYQVSLPLLTQFDNKDKKVYEPPISNTVVGIANNTDLGSNINRLVDLKFIASITDPSAEVNNLLTKP
ncbi:hypothetical protein J6590_030353 [Homalodisca vitripennis]|nr:hypothetical protein J6590_030353 [Homalodisca vitripennis]